MTAPIRRAAAIGALTAALVLAAPLAASAHVSVAPSTAEAGAEVTILSFAVPNESATATTTRVEIDLPTATPFGDVQFEPVAGWSGRVTTGSLPKPAKVDGATVTTAPTAVVFTAQAGTKLAAGEFQRFTLRVGPMPDTGEILLPAIQTYSDGTVVRWDEPTPASGEEPEHPAPVVYINDAPSADEAAHGATAMTPETATLQTSGDAGSDGLGVALGATGLGVGLVAMVLAGVALVRHSRRPRP